MDITCHSITWQMVADVADIIHSSQLKSDVSKLGPIKEELMKQDREDIDWSKLKLIVAQIKCDIGVNDVGMLKWTDTMAKNYINEKKSLSETGDSIDKPSKTESSKENICDNKKVESVEDKSNKLCQAKDGNNEAAPDLKRSDSSLKRKRELPQWMSCSEGRKEMAQKKVKTNTLFK